MIGRIVLIGVAVALVSSSAAFALSADEVKNLATAKIKAAVLEKHPGWSNVEIRISYKYASSAFSSLSGRKGKMTMAVVDMYPGFDPVGDVIVPLQVYVNEKEAEKIFLRTKVEAWKDVIVAKRKISKFAVISDEDVTLSRRDLGSLPKSVFFSANDCLGKQLISSISQGVTLQDWMVRNKPLVSKNEEIKIGARLDSLFASAKGIALQDGNGGDKVKVRNFDTKKEFTAVVVATGEVEVILN